MALIQEPWYSEGHIIGLNIPGYTLFYASRIDRPCKEHEYVHATGSSNKL